MAAGGSGKFSSLVLLMVALLPFFFFFFFFATTSAARSLGGGMASAFGVGGNDVCCSCSCSRIEPPEENYCICEGQWAGRCPSFCKQCYCNWRSNTCSCLDVAITYNQCFSISCPSAPPAPAAAATATATATHKQINHVLDAI